MAKGIVLQLQEEALDDSVNIETLLRKALLVAHKLKLKEFEEWILKEQNGYKEEPPEYRIIGGEIKAQNPYHGWVPVIMPSKIAEKLNKMPMTHPIATIADAYNGSNGSISFTVSGELTEFLNSNSGTFPTDFCFHSNKTELRKIISAVRNRILEWSLLLEENGIIGDELKFTDSEVKTAQDSQVINNYTNNFYSSVGNSQIQQGGNNNQQ